ncbi:hypothetical protein AOQ84DRAFT_431293 [Glonium stellatum]|uniref:Zn(2)-C6 fungal-type domain-containing protein n=1 Tax=Glonium stellatum TaxID=574774 RepID=A0A8E2F2W9_9PEZI|nr:hypothetical protein AOQ84DRAFT_431293 [Glonium stellatum]
MYLGSHPPIGNERTARVPDSHPSLAAPLDMKRLPGLPVPLEPQQSYFTWAPYQRPDGDQPRQKHLPSTHHSRDSESAGGSQQLPSLRTLLQPQLLESKPPESSPQLSGARPPNAPVGYQSPSPTLKRRQDADCYSCDRSGEDASLTRAPPVLRPSQIASTPDAQALSNPTSHTPDFVRHPRPTHPDPIQKIQRPPSTASGISGSSESVVTLSMHATHEDSLDTPRAPARRRAESSQRAPARTSRCVGQRDISGEGLCYVYEDGSFCRVVIDGEPVNPSWGITKAGKPRKRLAQACLTCREKKIKCEPAIPKCHQCTKSQRVCRGGLNQPSLSTTTDEPSSSGTSSPFKSRSMELLSPVAGPSQSRSWDGPLSTQPPRKAPRTLDTSNPSSSPSKHLKNLRSTSATGGRDMSVHSFETEWSSLANGIEPSVHEDGRRGSHHVDQLALGWEQDPYEADPGLTSSLLNLYFTHIGSATYCIFPPQHFTAWVETCREKSHDDRMLLYSVLAMGSVFATDSGERSVGKQFAGIAAYATERRFGRFSLQLCQSRLMLALYNFARGKATEAWDFCGLALRAISALKLNTEEGVKDIPDDIDLDFGFDRLTLEECRRRTFWSGFLMDRYNGFCGGTLCVIHPEDTFLRLPCLESAYGSSAPPETPLFDFELLKKGLPSNPALGAMAYLTLISAIWGDVMSHTGRAVHRFDNTYEKLYQDFYSRTCDRLEAWMTHLPSHLRYSPHNLDISIADGYAGTFLSIHALYHTTTMRLNRHVRPISLSSSIIRRNIIQATHDATQFLSVMQALSHSSRLQRLPSTHFIFSTPFPGYALMIACDILTSGGLVSELPSLMQSIGGSISCIDELAEFWASARAQQKAIEMRLKQLAEIALSSKDSNNRKGAFWRVGSPLETAFRKQDDVIYGVTDEVFFDAIKGAGGGL